MRDFQTDIKLVEVPLDQKESKISDFNAYFESCDGLYPRDDSPMNRQKTQQMEKIIPSRQSVEEAVSPEPRRTNVQEMEKIEEVKGN